VQNRINKFVCVFCHFSVKKSSQHATGLKLLVSLRDLPSDHDIEQSDGSKCDRPIQSRKKYLECEMCRKMFMFASELKRHSLIHAEE
jgi:hypothetical protein